jgi:hypothetical protein
MATIEELADQLESLNPESLAELARFIEYLRWKQGSIAGDVLGKPWSFDFVEHFRQAVVSADPDPAGMEVRVGEASCGEQLRMALWQHPPVQGSAIIEYQVPVPADVSDLRICFASGIRDGSQLAHGNVVAFRLFVNNWKLWSDTQQIRQWREHEIAMPLLAGDVVRIQFVTDGLGNHRWAWSAWAEPCLVGTIKA